MQEERMIAQHWVQTDWERPGYEFLERLGVVARKLGPAQAADLAERALESAERAIKEKKRSVPPPPPQP